MQIAILVLSLALSAHASPIAKESPITDDIVPEEVLTTELVAPDPCAKWKAQQEENDNLNKEFVRFVDKNSAELHEKGKAVLDGVADYLRSDHDEAVQFCHKCFGKAEGCSKVILERASTVEEYLHSKGLDSTFIKSNKCRTSIGVRIVSISKEAPLPPPECNTDGPVEIQIAANPEWCLNDHNWGNINDKADVNIWKCNNHNSMKWQFYPTGEIKLAASGVFNLCLNLPFYTLANGAALDVHACNGHPSQQWERDGKTIRLKSQTDAPSLWCLNNHLRAHYNGAVANLWSCNGDASQEWVTAPTKVNQ